MLQVHGIGRIYQKLDATVQDECFKLLMEECKYKPPNSKFSYNLRNRLEKFPLEIRKEIASRYYNGYSPLFMACKRGQVEMVQYLLDVCEVDIEQQGIYEVPDDRSIHSVTSLWCAAVSGKFPVVQLLVERGANVNAPSDSGSTPVRSACFMSHMEVVKFLVKSGADINRPNFNGGTCLINSVQSVELCQFLLDNDADVNAKDIQRKTALHYAIQEHRLETAKLLVENGADCKSKSMYGDDALQTACLKGAVNIFEYLINVVNYSEEELANAYELLGSTFMDEHNDMLTAVKYWRIGQGIRDSNSLIRKMPMQEPKECFGFQKEFQSLDELESMIADIDSMRIQSLLIAERILGPNHKDTVFRMMFRGATYADMMMFQRCIDLWRRVLEVRVEKDTILYTDTTFTAGALVRFMVDYNEKITPPDSQDLTIQKQRFKDALTTFQILVKDIHDARDLLKIRPQYKKQLENFDKILRCLIHLVYLMLQTANGQEDLQICRENVMRLVKLKVKCTTHGDSLLHLCVTKNNTLRTQFFDTDDEAIAISPQYQVVKFFLDCGVDVNERNWSRETPLHIASQPVNANDWLIPLLLSRGAHIDVPNSKGEVVTKKINEPPFNLGIYTMQHLSLQCLSATVIAKHKIPYKDLIPKGLEKIIQLHSS